MGKLNYITKSFDIFLNATKGKCFAMDVLKLAGGAVIAQSMTILATPIITRIYGPESFGLSALFASITGIIVVVACLRYDLSIVLPEKDEDAANLLALSLLLATAMSGITIFSVWLCGDKLLSLLNAPKLEPYLWIVPISVFLGGVFSALNYWNSRTKRFGRLSVSKVMGSVTATGTQLSAGIAGYPTGGSLIEASLLGSMVSTLMLGWQIWKSEKNSLARCLSWIVIIRMAKRYKEFPQISTCSALLNVISWQLPILLLSAFFSTKVTGYYSLSFMMVGLPMSLIGGAIGQVFFQRAAEAQKMNMLSSLTENTFEALLIIGMMPMLLLTVVGSDLFILFFGESWSEAGIYSQIIAFWALIWFISSPLSTLIDVLEKQKFGFFYNIANFIGRLIALCAGGLLFNNARLALIFFTIAGVLVYGYLCIGLMLRSGSNLSRIYHISSHYLIRSLPGVIIIVLLKLSGANPLTCTVASGFILLIYYLYLMKTNSRISGLFKGEIL